MSRRWSAGQSTSVSGVSFRVVVGKKEPGDLRLEWRTSAGWRPIDMAAAALMVDFFVENEEHLRQYRPHWQQTGADYFFGFLHDAVDTGWEAANDTLQAQRQGREARPPVAPVVAFWEPDAPPCPALSPEDEEQCTLALGHEGVHKSASWIWAVAA